MASRDTFRERQFLNEAARGSTAFVTHAEQRLAAGEETYGSSWASVGVCRLLAELAEEAVDLAAWAVLADQALDRDGQISDLHKQQIRAVLTTVARRGGQAHEALTIALKSVERPR